MMKPLIANQPTALISLRAWVLKICWVWLISHAVAIAQTDSPTSPAMAGWLDRDGSATVDTVQHMASWESFTGWRSWGFGTEPVWIRITVPAASHAAASPQILVVRPPYLDRVTFFDPTTGTVRHAGDFLQNKEEALASVLFTFEVPARTEVRDVLLKLESSSSRLVYLSLMPQVEAQSLTRWVEWVTGGALLLSLVFSVWAVVQWRISRDRVTATFAFNQLMVTLWGYFLFGFARVMVGDWFAEGVLSLLTSVIATVMVCAIFWFFAALLAEYSARSWMLWVLWASGWVFLSLAVLCIVGPTFLALKFVNALASFMLGWIVLTLWFAPGGRLHPPVPKVMMLGYVFIYALFNAIPTLTHVGLIPESRILFFGNMSNLVANGLIMLIILHVRQRHFRAQHEAMATQLMLQHEQARVNQQYLDDQRKLLAMLAHEIKTPLANLRIWMEAGDKGRPAMERAIHDMNRVIERCVHSGQLSDRSLHPRNEWLDAVELTQSVLTSSRQPERVRLEVPTDPCPVQTDTHMLSIVLSNVLENAYKYSAPGTPIALRLTAANGPQGQVGWRWQVDNDLGAAGWPDAEQLFEKYHRGPLARRQSGSGLGLFLVKALLNLMQGEVVYAPSEGRVRFEMWLPSQIHVV